MVDVLEGKRNELPLHLQPEQPILGIQIRALSLLTLSANSCPSMLIVSLSYLLQTMLQNLSPCHPFSAFSIIPSIITSSQQMIKPFCWIKASDWWRAKFQGQIRILIPSGSSVLLLSLVYIHWCSALCLDVNLQYFQFNLKFSRTRLFSFFYPHIHNSATDYKPD